MKRRIVVLGSGVNELVAGHTLARAGCDVTMIASPGTVLPWLETGSIPPRIARELGLEGTDYAPSAPDPWAVIPLPAGGTLELARDVAATAAAIERVSPADARNWPAFCGLMHDLARGLEAFYRRPPPDPLATTLTGLRGLAAASWRLRGLKRAGMEAFFRALPMSAADLLDDWFENDALKGALGAASVRNLAQGPRSAGTVFNLLHHHVGSPPGVFIPPLSNVRSGLQRKAGLVERIGKAASIELRDERAVGVRLDDGEAVPADAIVSGLTPARTLLDLVDPGFLDPELVRALRHIRSRGAAARIRLTLDRPPPFTCLVVAGSLDDLERAYDDFKYGRASAAPFVEARAIGAGAGGRHEVEIHAQYAPHALKEGVWDSATAEAFARVVIARIGASVPGFAESVIERSILTPDDLEHLHGFPQGQEYHAEIALDQALWMRPVPQLAGYATPIGGLYLCGPAMHPGGGIPGAAGANAARIVLRDLKRRS